MDVSGVEASPITVSNFFVISTLGRNHFLLDTKIQDAEITVAATIRCTSVHLNVS